MGDVVYKISKEDKNHLTGLFWVDVEASDITGDDLFEFISVVEFKENCEITACSGMRLLFRRNK